MSKCKNGHFEEIGAWWQILQIMGNSTFDTHVSHGAVFIWKWEIFSPHLLVCAVVPLMKVNTARWAS